MSTDDDYEETHVIIIGAGPTGALLSALLTQADVPHVLLEKEQAVVTDPRGIALDEDGIRVLQGLGLYDKIYTSIGQSVEYLFFISGKDGLDTRPFLKVNLGTSEGMTGHPGVVCHQQPIMEQWIRSVAGGVHGAFFRLGAEVLDIQEDQDGVGVKAKYLDLNGSVQWVKGKFLIGCDGKTGFTRKRYLEPRGVVMESKPGYAYNETWVAVNYGITAPTPHTHADFPLWKVGYSPDQVYDAFFPHNFRFIGNPDRPAVCGTFGRRQDRLWRFEFVVQGEEDANEMATFEKASSIIFPYLTHEGTKYGLPDRIQFPPDCITVLRSRPFTFSARSCNKWALDRVILCGDAAHVMPPFGGQGIASGFRDASGLAWRLALTYRSPQVHHSALFDGWCAERKQQLDRSIAATVTNGNFCTTRSTVKIFFRNWALWFMQQMPSWNRWLERGPRNEGAVRYSWSKNMAFLPEFSGGIAFPQVYCAPLQQSLSQEKPSVLFTDDVIFRSDKKSLFQLVVLVDSLSEAVEALRLVNDSTTRSRFGAYLDGQEACCIIHDPTLRREDLDGGSQAVAHRLYRIATGDEFSVSDLCRGRPEPVGYDMHRLRRDLGLAKYVVLRPDRFVYAACASVEKLVSACESIETVLAGAERKGLSSRLLE